MRMNLKDEFRRFAQPNDGIEEKILVSSFPWEPISLVSSFLWEPISSLQLSKGANSTSPAFYGRKFWSLAFHGNQSLVSSFLWEPISSLQLSKGANSTSPAFYGRKFWSLAFHGNQSLWSLAFYGNQSPVSSFLREQILHLQLSTGENFGL
ncbi:hypothetical protein V6N13_057083 [Hibiscus sabdariffa]